MKGYKIHLDKPSAISDRSYQNRHKAIRGSDKSPCEVSPSAVVLAIALSVDPTLEKSIEAQIQARKKYSRTHDC